VPGCPGNGGGGAHSSTHEGKGVRAVKALKTEHGSSVSGVPCQMGCALEQA